MFNSIFFRIKKTIKTLPVNFTNKNNIPLNHSHNKKEYFGQSFVKLAKPEIREIIKSPKKAHQNLNINSKKTKTLNRFSVTIPPSNTKVYKNEISIQKPNAFKEIPLEIPIVQAPKNSYSFNLSVHKEKLVQIVNQINTLKGQINSETNLQYLKKIAIKLNKLEIDKEITTQSIIFYATQMPEYNLYPKAENIPINVIDPMDQSKLEFLEKNLKYIRNIKTIKNSELIKEGLSIVKSITIHGMDHSKLEQLKEIINNLNEEIRHKKHIKEKLSTIKNLILTNKFEN
ncbi:MAG: hypothetical protein ON057_000129 [Glomeribacter sp. 1016415]|nr:hypothetical protein [Glomeribacter sp. 1016415]